MAPAEGVTTLYARDPLERTFCFRDGKYGGVIQQNEVRNRSSDIDFNNYVADAFTVAVEGSELGTIVDLGPADPNDPGFDLLVKMYVVSYQPGDYVTIRYQVL